VHILNLWNPVMGMRQTNWIKNNSTIPIETPQNYNKCTLVRQQQPASQ
jgi:hypothetical protein